MIALWMLYVISWGLWLSAVAGLVERLMLRGRGPARVVWISALLLSVVGPLVGVALSKPKPSTAAQTVTAPASSPPVIVTVRSQSPAVAPHSVLPIVTFRDVAARFDRPLILAWVLSSLGLAIYLAGGALRLAILRRAWRPHVIGRTPILVSEDTGPALVGVFKPAIVFPSWALSLEPELVALMLRHEGEHRAAGDTRVLAFAQVLLVLIPWSAALWWQLRRLRLAIELDCDSRVLGGTTDVAMYGRLLLDLGRARGGLRFIGAGLADHATNLEARIRHMTRHGGMKRGRALAISVLAGGFAVAVGCQLPAPESSPVADATTPQRIPPAVTAHADSISSRTAQDTLIQQRRRLVADSTVFRASTRDTSARMAQRESSTSSQVVAPQDTLGRGPLVLQLFNAAVVLDTATDPVVRARYQPRMIWTRLMLDSLVRASQVYTQDHPVIRELNARFFDQLKRQTDSANVRLDVIAQRGEAPGCKASASSNGEGFVTLVISDTPAERRGRVVLTGEATTDSGMKVEYDRPGVTCRAVGAADIRIYGRGAFDQTPIFVQSGVRTSLVVVTASGRVLAGPVAVRNETRRYELAWDQ